MTKYDCGHELKHVFIRKSFIAKDIAIYDDWKKSKGFKGDKSQCIHCFWKSLSKDKQQEYDVHQKTFDLLRKWHEEDKKSLSEAKKE